MKSETETAMSALPTSLKHRVLKEVLVMEILIDSRVMNGQKKR